MLKHTNNYHLPYALLTLTELTLNNIITQNMKKENLSELRVVCWLVLPFRQAKVDSHSAGSLDEMRQCDIKEKKKHTSKTFERDTNQSPIIHLVSQYSFAVKNWSEGATVYTVGCN